MNHLAPLRSRRLTPRVRAPLLACLGLSLASCSSTPTAEEKDDEPRFSVEGYDENSLRLEEKPIGLLLAEIDGSVRAWTNLTLTASTQEQRKKAELLDKNLAMVAKNRLDDLIVQLENGPPNNRMRAAAAVGFSRDPAALSPLLTALHDPERDVVHNALLGLAVLQQADTPLAVVCDLFHSSDDAQTRSNAIYALLNVVMAGGGSQCVVPTARTGLNDPEPFVRAQATLLLSLYCSPEDVDSIDELLYDEQPFVAVSAMRSLIHIALCGSVSMGPSARALASSIDRVEPRVRPRVLGALRALREADLGPEAGPWLEWAFKLP